MGCGMRWTPSRAVRTDQVFFAVYAPAPWNTVARCTRAFPIIYSTRPATLAEVMEDSKIK